MARWNQFRWNSGVRWNEPDSVTSTPNPKKAMAANRLPDAILKLLTLGEDMYDGLVTHEVALNLKHNSAALLRADLDAMSAAENAFQQARADRKGLVTAQTVADSNGRAFLAQARRALAVHLGDKWSAEWLPTGFPNNSTAVPGSMPERQGVLLALKPYFTAHPAQEIAGKSITGAQALALGQALSTARSAVNAKDEVIRTRKVARDGADEALRARMSNTIAEVGQLMGPDDPRWHALGLNMPSDPSAPEAVADLTLTGTAAGTVFADWPDARRADRYHVQVQVVGVDAEWRRAETREESDATLGGLTSGSTLRVQIVPVNIDGESGGISPVREIVVP